MSLPPLEVVRVRDLMVENPSPTGRPTWRRPAASRAPVRHHGDRHRRRREPLLGGHDRRREPGSFARIIAGRLSIHEATRAEEKPDLEALTILPPFERNAHGALLACGSGGVSRGGSRRSTGVAFTLDADGSLAGFPCEVDLEPLHVFVERHVEGPINLEGICVRGDELLLAQRNSVDEEGRPGQNVLLTLSLARVMESMLSDLTIDADELLGMRAYDLGHRALEVEGESVEVKLDFTDLDGVSDDPHGRVAFTAAAEGLRGTPADGRLAGSVVGLIDPDGEIVLQVPVADPELKLEGLDARFDPGSGRIDLLLVSDADDPGVPAPLMTASLPG